MKTSDTSLSFRLRTLQASSPCFSCDSGTLMWATSVSGVVSGRRSVLVCPWCGAEVAVEEAEMVVAMDEAVLTAA